MRAVKHRSPALPAELGRRKRRESLTRPPPDEADVKPPRSGAAGRVVSWRLAILGSLTAAAAVLTSFRLGSQSLWGDEVFSADFAVRGLRALPGDIVAEANMAPYHVLLHFWLYLGHSEATIRALSVVFAVASVPLLFFLAERLFGRTVAAMASLLLIPNAFYIHYAQEARSYALVLFLSLVASTLFVRALDHASDGNWIGYALAVAVGTWAHFFMFLVILAHLLALAFVEADWRPPRRVLVRAYGLILVLLAPLAPLVAVQKGTKARWMTAPSPADGVRAIEALAGGTKLLLVAYSVMCLPFAFAGVAALRRRTDPETWPYAFVLSWLVVPVVVSFVVSQARPIYLDRYLIVVLPALVIAAAAGAIRFGPRSIGALVVAATVVLSGAALRDYYEHPSKPDWRGLAAVVLGHARPGDGVVVVPSGQHGPLSYYLARAPKSEPRPASLYPRRSWTFPETDIGGESRPSAVFVRSEENGTTRIWLIVQTRRHVTLTANERRILQFTVAGRVPVLTRDFRYIRLELLQRATAA